MLSPRTIARLGALNRDATLRPLSADAAPTPRPSATSLVEPEKAPAEHEVAARQMPTAPSQLPAGVEVENAAGKHWLIQRPLSLVWRDGDERVARWRERRDSAEPPDGQAHHAELLALTKHFTPGFAALDLETCGLAGSCLFLAGLLHETDGGLVLSQLLARDYSEEAALLHTLWEIVSGKGVLVTFNGKSFDWPCVCDRSTLHGVGPSAPARRGSADAKSVPDEPLSPQVHCDILHHARRRWKQHLPNCKLQTLERWICGRRRVGDIPGSEIPAAYHRYVRTSDAWEVRSILHHNALDLVTLLQLAMVLATAPNRD